MAEETFAGSATTYQLYGGKTKRDYYESQLGQLKSERSSFDSHWKELADWILPQRVRFTTSDRNRGDKRRQNIIDSTAGFASRTLQSGLHAGLTSPARPWFKLGTPDPDLAQFGPVKEYLHLATKRMLAIFQQTNLYNSLPIVYGDLGTFGTGAMSVIADDRDLFRTFTYPLGSYVVGMDARGRASVFMREYELTVRQVIEQFGGPNGTHAIPGKPIDWTNIAPSTKALWEQGTHDAPIQLVWVVAPNQEADPTRIGARYMPFTSCYFERGQDNTGKKGGLLRESGFRQFPVMVPRWEIVGEDSYGRECPGMIALGDVKQLQIQQKKKAQGIAKQVDPPLVGPVALRTQKTSLLAGDVTYVDQREGMSGLRAIHEVNIRLDHLVQSEAQTQYRIQRAYYEDLFLMLARSDMDGGVQPITAREVAERHEEKLLALGPVLERTNDELLEPLIDRVFEMMETEELLPPAPEELRGVDLKVEFVSIMAQAQQLVGVVGQDRFLQTIMPLAQIAPSVLRKVNLNQLVDNYAEMLGIDPRVVVPTEQAEKAEADAQRQAQVAQAAATAKDAASAAKTVSEIPAGAGANPSMLDRVLNGVGA